MMTSSNGNIFRVTGPLWGASTGRQWIPLTNASDAKLWCFLWSAPEQIIEQTIETLLIWDAMAFIITSLQLWKWRLSLLMTVEEVTVQPDPKDHETEKPVEAPPPVVPPREPKVTEIPIRTSDVGSYIDRLNAQDGGGGLEKEFMVRISVIIASKWRHDVILTLLLRHLFAGKHSRNDNPMKRLSDTITIVVVVIYWLYMSKGRDTCSAQCHYNAVNFLENPHNRHSIARPSGRVKGYLMWVHLWLILTHCSAVWNILLYCTTS